jgi:hypothetical protein
MCRLLAFAGVAVWTAACGSAAAPTPPAVEPPPLEDVIEALFLGAGPISPANHDCVLRGQWAAPSPGSAVAVVMSPTIVSSGEAVLSRTLDDLRAVISGRFIISLARSTDVEPRAAAGQITTTDVPAARFAMLCGAGNGCTHITSRAGPVIVSAEAVQNAGEPDRVKVHELGHALGLCHVTGDRMPDAIMSNQFVAPERDRFSALELAAIRAVYASALEPGAGPAEFRAAGLIR